LYWARSVLDVGQELTSLAHEVEPPTEEIPRRPHRGGIHVGLRQHPAAEQDGDLL
jgi:hypothetical protein